MSPPYRFAIVLELEGDSSPLAAAVSAPGWIDAVAAALQAQLREDVAPHYPAAADAVVRVSKGDDLDAGEVVLAIVPKLPDAPGDIAYHSAHSDNLAPWAVEALDTCSTPQEATRAMSHELIETVADPDCAQSKPTGDGHRVAYEPADPVQETSYTKDGIEVSDFVLPSWFDPNGTGPFSYVDKQTGNATVVGPFQVASGGYEVTEDANGVPAMRGANVRDGKRRALAHWSSRVSRRLARK